MSNLNALILALLSGGGLSGLGTFLLIRAKRAKIRSEADKLDADAAETIVQAAGGVAALQAAQIERMNKRMEALEAALEKALQRIDTQADDFRAQVEDVTKDRDRLRIERDQLLRKVDRLEARVAHLEEGIGE